MASDFEAFFQALADAQVRSLRVGGVAVLLHGTPRFTANCHRDALSFARLRWATAASLWYSGRGRAPTKPGLQ